MGSPPEQWPYLLIHGSTSVMVLALWKIHPGTRNKDKSFQCNNVCPLARQVPARFLQDESRNRHTFLLTDSPPKKGVFLSPKKEHSCHLENRKSPHRVYAIDPDLPHAGPMSLLLRAIGMPRVDI